MRRSAFQFTIAIPKMWFGHPPQQPEPIGLNKPSRKEACPKTSRYQPAFRPMFAFRPAPMPTRRPCLTGAPFRPALIPTWRPCFARHLYSPGGHISTGAPFRLTPCPHDARTSPGAHACLAFAFRPLLRFDRCPCPPGAHAHPTSLFCQALMLTWYSCLTRYSREIAAAHTVHGLQELIPHGKNRTACMISRLPT